mgnify:CR=1 FL=1
MVAFQNNPVEFLGDVVATQQHKYKIIASNTREGEAVRLARFYQQPVIKEAVSMYLDRSGGNK